MIEMAEAVSCYVSGIGEPGELSSSERILDQSEELRAEQKSIGRLEAEILHHSVDSHE